MLWITNGGAGGYVDPVGQIVQIELAGSTGSMPINMSLARYTVKSINFRQEAISCTLSWRYSLFWQVWSPPKEALRRLGHDMHVQPISPALPPKRREGSIYSILYRALATVEVPIAPIRVRGRKTSIQFAVAGTTKVRVRVTCPEGPLTTSIAAGPARGFR